MKVGVSEVSLPILEASLGVLSAVLLPLGYNRQKYFGLWQLRDHITMLNTTKDAPGGGTRGREVLISGRDFHNNTQQ